MFGFHRCCYILQRRRILLPYHDTESVVSISIFLWASAVSQESLFLTPLQQCMVSLVFPLGAAAQFEHCFLELLTHTTDPPLVCGDGSMTSLFRGHPAIELLISLI